MVIRWEVPVKSDNEVMKNDVLFQHIMAQPSAHSVDTIFLPQSQWQRFTELHAGLVFSPYNGAIEMDGILTLCVGSKKHYNELAIRSGTMKFSYSRMQRGKMSNSLRECYDRSRAPAFPFFYAFYLPVGISRQARLELSEGMPDSDFGEVVMKSLFSSGKHSYYVRRKATATVAGLGTIDEEESNGGK
eukprot:GHVS01019470.1.p1 GENE.GHVS01019470.1~~GHVS01019470.1.p1  ORF type:complete len:188 (-),score=17.34 GHVS01019470.1:335-898(-)